MNPSLLIRVLSTLALTLASGAAQGGFVVPSKALTREPGVLYEDSMPQPTPFLSLAGAFGASRSLYLYDVADITLQSGLLTGMAVRPPADHGVPSVRCVTRITVSVSSANAFAPSPVFADNHGVQTSVFDGTLDLGARSASRWPAHWESPIAFAAPLPYDRRAGTSLAVEFETRSSTAPGIWHLEGYTTEFGKMAIEFSQPSCGNGGRSWVTPWSPPGSLAPGGTFALEFSGYPQATPSLAANVLIVSTSGLGSQMGNVRTPFPLSWLAPSHPNCAWAIGVNDAIAVTMRYERGRLALRPGLPIPHLPSMANRLLFAQNIAIDTDSLNRPVLLSSPAVRCLIGTGNPLPASMVSALFDPRGPRPAAGTLYASNGATLRFLE